jgi:hypothetical protein
MFIALAAGAQAATNVALSPDATFVSASSFLDFFGEYGITVDPDGQQTAQTNVISNVHTPYTGNGETRYIFDTSDTSPSFIIDLGHEYTLTSVGATWFDAAYQDRAPSSVSVSFSDTDGSFGSTVTDASPVYGGSSDLIALSSPITAQYIEFSFGDVGGTAIAQVFANAVPEPTSWALMLIGLGVVGGGLRSRRPTVPNA